MEEKRPVLRRSTLILFAKNIVLQGERGDLSHRETRRWARVHQGDQERYLFDHEDVKHSTRTGRPVSGLESTQSCVLMPTKNEEEDQTRTERPVKVEELDVDFRVPGLSGHLRVQELVKKIESHPNREALQAELQQNNVYNPFSISSKAMVL